MNTTWKAFVALEMRRSSARNSGRGRPSGRSRSEPANGGSSGSRDDSPPVKWATLSSWLISGDSVAAIDGGPVEEKLSAIA